MTGTRHEDINTYLYAAAMIAAAAFLRYLNGILGHSLFRAMAVSLIFISLFTAWGISLRRRIIRPGTRRLLSLAVGMMVAWMGFRTLKYEIATTPDMIRHLWYAYYIPILLIPHFCLLAALYLDRPPEYRLPPGVLLLYVPTLLLILMVLTNDLHQAAFSFPENAAAWTDEEYTRGPVYYAAMIWAGICALSCILLMIRKCRLPGRSGILFLPLVPLGALILYTVIYVTHFEWLFSILDDMTLTSCLLITAILESCADAGLMQTSTGYQELFEHGRLNARILDRQGNTVYSSGGAGSFPKETLQKVISEGEMLTDHSLLLHSHPIRGGSVVWETDVSELTEVIEELEENRESLEEQVLLEQERLRTRRQTEELREQNRIYELLQQQTAAQTARMEELLERFEAAEDPEERQDLLRKCAVYCAYVKRRGNLALIGERQQIQMTDLALCFQESLSNLELSGAECALDFPKEGSLSYENAAGFYDFFENVIEADLDRLQAVYVKMRQREMPALQDGTGAKETCWELILELECAPADGAVGETWAALAGRADAYREEDGMVSFVLRSREKGGTV